MFSDEELRELREVLDWLKAAESSFDFWNSDEDAVFDSRWTRRSDLSSSERRWALVVFTRSSLPPSRVQQIDHSGLILG